MVSVFEESGYIFDFNNSVSACKADDQAYNDLTAVDFVIETAEDFLFIEVKNADNEKATEKSRKAFFEDLHKPTFPYQVGGKFKDTLLRRWACEEVFEKPIRCVFVLEYKSFTKTERGMLKEKIHNRIPFSLNKAEFGGKKHFGKFELLTVNEFCDAFPDFQVNSIQ